MPESMIHPIREPSVESRLLNARLEKLNELEMVSYRDLSEIAKLDVRQNKGRGYLTTAIRMAQRHGKVFRPVRGIGIVRCDSEAMAGLIEAGRNTIRRKSHRQVKIGECADISKMSVETKNRFLALMSQMQMLEYASRETSTKKLIHEAEKTQKQLPLREMLEALK